MMVCGMLRESFRTFSGELEALAEKWAGTALTTDAWKDDGFFGGTESKPFKVSCGSVSGIAKPGVKKNDGVWRAAQEKIASDLAFELKLPIPPVILLDIGEHTDATRERYVSISAITFPQPTSWAQASATFTDAHKNEASQVMSAMLALETWVSCTDRKADHVLAYLPSASEPLQLAFIDFAFSMAQQWKSADDPAGVTAPYLPVQRDDVSLKTMIERIESFDDAKVEAIATRIPKDYLPEDKRALIIANLKNRKPKLRGLFGMK
jgi:hypothetical protein